MRISTLIKYLFGNRQAILDVANSHGALWLGLVFVMSAGFAREYDAEDLVHEPWYLLIPLGASLVTSLLLFLLLHITLYKTRHAETGWSWSRYKIFLSLYWMTAPLAWLYAFPIERLAEPGVAVQTNLALLGIVSLWRVVLMTRVVSVIYQRPVWAAFFVVMLFGDTVLIGIVSLTPLPIFNMMGGIGLTESETLIQVTAFLVTGLALLSWLVWLIGTVFAATLGRGRDPGWSGVTLDAEQRMPVAWQLWGLAIASIVIWCAFLPFTQREQKNRRHAELQLWNGSVDAALSYMSAREPGDFPPHWDPPPQVGYGEDTPDLIETVLRAEQADVAPWVRDLFRQKLIVQAEGATTHFFRDRAIQLEYFSDERLTAYAKLLQQVPYGEAMARYHENEIGYLLQRGPDQTSRLSDSRREVLQSILDLIPAEDRAPD